jgi:hypothetical protein
MVLNLPAQLLFYFAVNVLIQLVEHLLAFAIMMSVGIHNHSESDPKRPSPFLLSIVNFRKFSDKQPRHTLLLRLRMSAYVCLMHSREGRLQGGAKDMWWRHVPDNVLL